MPQKVGECGIDLLEKFLAYAPKQRLLLVWIASTSLSCRGAAVETCRHLQDVGSLGFVKVQGF